MAVTINDMQVDVRDRAAQTPAPSGSAAPTPIVSLRRELLSRDEREQRLKAD
ncbi:MAG TPA: hypothetical protein VK789_20220 [Bryobacteraceae bacterium]|jgi:hypothetical protein|nr:hypothetical protein [Bryobacteraceae bacterium]